MANNCWYELRAVSKSRSALERLLKIMNYEDPEYYLYRVFSVNEDEGCIEEAELEEPQMLDNGEMSEPVMGYAVTITGDVAWSVHRWFDDAASLEPDADGSRYVTFQELCPALDIAVECFGEECGCAFQEFHACDRDGNSYVDQCNEWGEPYFQTEEDFNDFIESMRGTVVIDKEIADDIRSDLRKGHEPASTEYGGLDLDYFSTDDMVWAGEVRELKELNTFRYRE